MASVFKYLDNVSESSSSEDQDSFDSLYDGQAYSIISSLEETIKKIDNFLSFERQFFIGDTVCLASGPKQQSGKVINVEMHVSLETVSGIKLENVNCRDLQRIRSVMVGDYVILGPWFGKVERTTDRITLLFDDGRKCQLSGDDAEKLVILPQDVLEDSVYCFFPGQRIRVEQPSVNGLPRWWCGKIKDKRDYGSIVDVETGVAYVEWLCCAFMNDENACCPPSMQDPEHLTVFSAFPHASWQLGDWCLVPVERGVLYPYSSSVMTREDKGSKALIQHADFSSSFRQAAVITGTKTKCDVLWQDGSESHGLDSNTLVPVNVLDAHDFWPHAFVLEKVALDGTRKWGVVVSIDPKERTSQVKWYDSEEEQTVSCYELIEHPEYTFCLGEMVCKMALRSPDTNGESSSYFGTVSGFQNGSLEVKWSGGETSKVAPFEIYSVDKCRGTQSTNEEVSNAFSGVKVKDDSGMKSISQVAVGMLSSVVSRIYASLGAPYERACTECTSECRNSQLPEDEAVELCELKPAREVDSMESISSSRENHKHFKQFDLADDCSDHHFVKESGMEVKLPQMKGSWLKTIHKEWSILENDLPDTIYVRIHEERMDLLRAAIVGTDGTPYHDGLFFFDICFPPQYPYEPPMVHYISGGLRINPNLYESGKICLSLLNTWTGSETEAWNTESSTILQVLLSLQALVLNDKPYFNEAGYDSQVGKAEGENNSVSYNENAFLVNCRSILYTLGHPPKNFEELVKEHFNGRCRKFLLACEAYMDGAQLGQPFHYMNCEEANLKKTSTGFKIMLSKLYPQLVEAFSGM